VVFILTRSGWEQEYARTSDLTEVSEFPALWLVVYIEKSNYFIMCISLFLNY